MRIIDYLNNYHLITPDDLALFPYIDSKTFDVIEGIIKYRYGLRELYYNGEDDAVEPYIHNVVLNLFYDNDYKWQRLQASQKIEFDPTQLTNFTETYSEKHSGSDTSDNSNIPGTTSTVSRSSYDASTLADVESTKLSGNDEVKSNVTYGHEISTTKTYQGYQNINIDDVLERDRKAADFSYLSIIAEDIANEISLLTYIV